MKIKLCPTGGLTESMTIECIDENTLRIDVDGYEFPVDVHEFDPFGPILSARRDESGELLVTVHVLYSDAHRAVWETKENNGKYRGEDWETWVTGQKLYPEEVLNAGNDGTN